MNEMFQDHQREKELLQRLLFFQEDQLYIPKIKENVFDHQIHRQIFFILKKMYEKAYVITLNTFKDYVKDHSKAINNDQILETVSSLPAGTLATNEHLPHLTDIFYKREINNGVRTLAEMLPHSPVESIIQYANKKFSGFEKTVDVKTIPELTKSVRQSIIHARDYGPKTIKTGIKGIDDAIGFIPSTQCLVIGKSGEGKSAFVNQLVMNICQNNEDIAVLYFSMEIREEKLIENFIGNLTSTTKDRMRGKTEIKISDIELETIDEMIALLETFTIEIHYGPKNSQEASLIIDLFAANNRDKQIVIVTDHHLYIEEEGDIQRSINKFSKMLVNKKEQYNALSFLLCQFHLRLTEEENKSGQRIPPDAKWIMYPGTLYMDTDTTIAIWRKNKVDELSTDDELVELYIQKNREGQPHILIPVVFTPKYGSWRGPIIETYRSNPELMSSLHGSQVEIPDF